MTEVKYDAEDGESITDKTLLRTILYQWTCNSDHRPCLDHASSKFQEWMANPDNPKL